MHFKQEIFLMKSLIQKQDWEKKRQKTYKNKIFSTEFDTIFSKFLKKHTNIKKSMLEIGCMPARFLAHIASQYGYYPEGIDYISGSKKACEETLLNSGINEFNIIENDFFKWTTSNKYDLVCSFGFIEHFNNPKSIVDKHIMLLNNYGLLIIEIPNFSGLQKYIHKWLDRENYENHNISIMNLSFFREVIIERKLRLMFLGYYGGFFNFWWENKSPSIIQLIAYIILRSISLLTKKININNRLLSPYIFLIAKKI